MTRRWESNNIDKNKGAAFIGVKDELRRFIEDMDDRWIHDVVACIRWLQLDMDTLTDNRLVACQPRRPLGSKR